MTRRNTNRWRGIAATTFLAAAVGLVFTVPAALVVGVVGGAYAGFARFDAPPDPTLAVERSLSDESPDRGDDVTVTVTVRNEGGFAPDLRIVDGVPDTLHVTEGSPRLATSLRRGKEATFRYAVEAERGEHAFDDVTVVARNAPGTIEVEESVECESSVECVPELGDLPGVPLRPQAARRVGRLTTDEAGAGVEFHATRAYRRGDPLSRVDWKRLARTGDLATVEFREERAGAVFVVVDTRAEAYVARPDDDSAVEYGVRAAGAVTGTLLDVGDRVGLASYGPTACWLPPGLGRDHRERLRRALATDPGFSPRPSDDRFFAARTFARIQKRLPADAQAVFCSPLCDDVAARFVRRLEAHGHPVTVVSPDVTAGSAPGDRLVRVERRVRLRELRRAGVRVVDWAPDDHLAVALTAAERRWQS